MITNHTELLNALIAKYNLKSYLEIGVQNPANNFDKVNIDWDCKKGVDPEVAGYANIATMTSDEFFKQWGGELIDLIFIDGLHHADQVKRDILNSLRCLSNNGFILVHDCLPVNETTTHEPRDSKIWHGTVYKEVMRLREYDGINFKTFNIDEGCCLIWKDSPKKGSKIPHEITFDFYIKNRVEYMKVVDDFEYI